VIVDLYPFEETLMSGADEKAIIEKIDIGGPTMIRAAAKNFESVAIVASKKQYGYITEILKNGNQTTLEQRKYLAGQAFATTLAYEMPIAGYFGTALRYGENPHQNGAFIGEMSEVFEFMQGKELSYNNLLDTEAAIKLMKDFSIPCFAILKHTNACGCATGNENTLELFKKAYMADTKSAFGGILITNQEVDGNVALYIIEELKLFIEVIIAPSFTKEALEILKRKPNVRVLKLKDFSLPTKEVRTSLTGFLVQDRDNNVEGNDDFETTTLRSPTSKELSDLVIGSIIAKHLKSNCVALVKDGMLLAMGSGQVSRVDALKSALAKAKNFKLDVAGGILASEAFFPFPDCVEIAGAAGITAVVHPGGSKDDKASIDMANKIGMAMVTTGIRHFKH
jgi:phosphoribosylaminoimidazolecarboxamide formyltransferase/IMP cyclohydrolase